MICIICGHKVGPGMPVPVAEVRFTPVIPYVPGLTPAKLGETVIRDRLCCQKCYKMLLDNDYEAIQEAGKIHNAD